MLQTALSRIAGFSSFPIVIVILGAFGLLLLRLFPALRDLLAGLADAITELFEGIRLGCAPFGLLLLPLELLWMLLCKVIELLWNLIDWLLDMLQSLFDLDGCGCGCAPLGCLMIPFALLASLFGLGGDDDDSGDGGGGAGGSGNRSRSSVGSTTSSATHAEAAQERAQSSVSERERSRGAGVGGALGAVGAAGTCHEAARAASSAASGVTEAVRGSRRSVSSTSHSERKTNRKRHTTRMVGKRASIPNQTGQSRVRRAVSSAVSGAKDAVAGAVSEATDNVKAAVGASTDPEYFDDVPQRRAFASAWSITDAEDARDIAEILAERDIPHSWQIDEATGLPTVTIPNYVAGQATGALSEHGFDVGEGMPADFVSVDRINDAPEAGTVYDPETGEWVTPEPEWDEGETVPALEERALYNPSEGALYDPITDSHFDEETQEWHGADGEPIAPDTEYVEDVEQHDVDADGEQPALPPPDDTPDFWWGPQPEPVRARQNEEDDDVIDATYEDVPRQGGEQ